MDITGKQGELLPGQEVTVSQNDSDKRKAYVKEYNRMYSQLMVRISVYFTKVDFPDVQASAKGDGLPVATFIRTNTLAKVHGKPFLTKEELAKLDELIFQFQKYGTLLNQVVKKINTTGEVTLDDFNVIRQTHNLLQEAAWEFFGNAKREEFLDLTDDANSNI